MGPIILKDIEKIINSELTSKIKKTSILYNELLIETEDNELISVILFLKSNDKLKFRQLIDIAGIDYPEEEKRFKLVYLLLSHEKNLRIKIQINLELKKKFQHLQKFFLRQIGWREKCLTCME